MSEYGHPLTLERRIELLEVGHAHMTRQMAEVTVAMQDVSRCLEQGGAKMSSVQSELQQTSQTIGEVRDILAAVKVGLKVIGGIGTLVRWAGYVAAAGAAIYTFWHMLKNGGKPPGV